jgi:hypothetical protein
MKFIIPLLLVMIIYSCKNEEKQIPDVEKKGSLTDSTLVTDSSWGPIKQDADLAMLEKLYGKSNIKDEWICGPECADTIHVTKIFPDQAQEITVFWDDSAFHKKIMMLEVYRDGNPYHTVHGLKSGSTLNDILKVNGQKITFSGFGWDYGGFIHSYNNGALERSPINFRLDYRGSQLDLDGDIELNTNMPHVKKALDSIYNYYLSLSFRKPGHP